MSQRAVAAELGVSQALLSHYENSQREPGLAFVVKAAEFYDVTTDYILGRTMGRDGHRLEIPDFSSLRDNTLKGSVLGTIQKNLVINSMSVIFDLADKTGNRTLLTQISEYLSLHIYKVFRYIYHFGNKNPPAMFKAPINRYQMLVQAEEALCEAKIADALENGEGEPLPISNDQLKQEYPVPFQSLITVLHNVDSRVSSHG
jgi:hypothetical protein